MFLLKILCSLCPARKCVSIRWRKNCLPPEDSTWMKQAVVVYIHIYIYTHTVYTLYIYTIYTLYIYYIYILYIYYIYTTLLEVQLKIIFSKIRLASLKTLNCFTFHKMSGHNFLVWTFTIICFGLRLVLWLTMAFYCLLNMLLHMLLRLDNCEL